MVVSFSYHNLKLFPQNNGQSKRHSLSSEKKSVFSIISLTASFATCQYGFRVFYGKCFKLHSGNFGPFLFCLGLLSSSGSLLFANKLNDVFNKFILKYVPAHRTDMTTFLFDDFLTPKQAGLSRSRGTEYDKQILTVSRLYGGLASYLILEGGNMRLSFPSSITALGSFASRRRWNSLPTDKAVATASQRSTIQKIGRRCGCHHCGSRWSKFFIADHMPPTKFVEEMKKKWYNRLFFKWKLQQRLWPQCEGCWRQQGQAVRMGALVLVYHWRPSIGLLAPAIALFLVGGAEEGALTDTMRQIAIPTVYLINVVMDKLKHFD